MDFFQVSGSLRTRLVLASVGICVAIPGSNVYADPTAGPIITPPVFCIRITDIERVDMDLSDAAFTIEFEVLNWTDTPASGFDLAVNVGIFRRRAINPPRFGGPPEIFRADIDPNGRGGPLAGQHIGPGFFDNPAIHSGRGRGDIPGFLNDWEVSTALSTQLNATWNVGAAGTPIPNRDLLDQLLVMPANPAASYLLVPGLGTDNLGDSAVDGGPSPYTDPVPAPPFLTGGEPVPNGSGNVLDGFVITVCDWDENETLAFNWCLLDATGNPIMNPFGFGVINLTRMAAGAALPNGIFNGNTGFLQSPLMFFGNVFQIPAEGTRGLAASDFAMEPGAAITAPFADPATNRFGFTITTQTILPLNHPAAPADLVPRADFNLDGVVDGADLGFLLGNWGEQGPINQ